jgi:hypothetical protein
MVISLWCTYTFDVHYDIFEIGYIYRLYYIPDIISIHFSYIVNDLNRLKK